MARSTFQSENVQNTPAPDHFLELRCRKSARRCGAKHILKSKCAKHTMLGPLLEVDFRKSARRCGAKHMSKSKCTKHTMLGPLLEVELSEKVHAVVARSTFPSQNVQNTPCSDHFWKLSCRKSQRRWKSKVLKTDGLGPLLEVEFRKSARRCGAKHIFKSKCTKHTMLGPLLEVEF